MKCKELMVGDFCRTGHGFPMQITKGLLGSNRWEVHSHTPFIRYFYAKNDSRHHLICSHGTLPVWLACGEANDGVLSYLTLPIKYVHHINSSRY